MKKSIALSAFALVMALPLVGNAASVTNAFVGSTSGTATIEVSDTIQFEVTITTDAGVNYTTILWSTTGDADSALLTTQGAGWPGVDNVVTQWEWHYTTGNPSVTGGSQVKMGTNGRFTPGVIPAPPPDRVVGPFGFFGASKTGDGTPSLVGTVTIHADAAGVYEGGGFQYPGVDTFAGSGGGGVVPYSGGDFTVVPEPGTALLMALGLSGLAVAGRRKN